MHRKKLKTFRELERIEGREKKPTSKVGLAESKNGNFSVKNFSLSQETNPAIDNRNLMMA